MARYMRCLRGLAIIVVIISSVVLIGILPGKCESGKLLYQSLSATGATVQEANVQGWTQLKPGIWNEAELKNAVQQAVTCLGDSSGNYRFDTSSTPERDSVCVVSNPNERQYTITASTIRDGNAFMTVVMSGSAEKVSDYQRQTAKILDAAGVRVQVNSCLVGWINGKLSSGEWAKMLHRSFTVLKAKVSDEMSDAQIASVTGYSPRLPGGLTFDGTRVNVNMASRYSSYENRTYILLGTPIIVREY